MPKAAFSSPKTVSITIDGVKVNVPCGITVAAAIMESGHSYIRTTPLSGQERSGYCQMGVCFECLTTIDGIPNQQGCLVKVHEGMQIARQHTAPVISSNEGS